MSWVTRLERDDNDALSAYRLSSFLARSSIKSIRSYQMRRAPFEGCVSFRPFHPKPDEKAGERTCFQRLVFASASRSAAFPAMVLSKRLKTPRAYASFSGREGDLMGKTNPMMSTMRLRSW
jgi:hypothetical protein